MTKLTRKKFTKTNLVNIKRHIGKRQYWQLICTKRFTTQNTKGTTQHTRNNY